MLPELVEKLPDNWVGLFAIIAFVVYVGLQIVEKYETIAKIVPLGKLWHDRQKSKRSQLAGMVAEDNEIIHALQNQVRSIVSELESVRETLRTFTAWSVYDARWHHQALVDVVGKDLSLEDHLDYFAFEKLWKEDPVAASKLPVLRGEK